MPQPAVTGIADHYGRAILVTVAAVDGKPFIVDRRHEPLIGPGLPDSPYHHESLELPLDEAEALVHRVRASVARECARVLDALVSEVSDHRVIAIAIRRGPVVDVPDDLAAILADHRALHAADGELYRGAMCLAAHERGLSIVEHDRRKPLRWASARLACHEDDLATMIRAAATSLGSPWTKEHTGAAAAAWATLTGEGQVETAS